MSGLMVVAGVLALFLLIYLFAVILFPEVLS